MWVNVNQYQRDQRGGEKGRERRRKMGRSLIVDQRIIPRT